MQLYPLYRQRNETEITDLVTTQTTALLVTNDTDGTIRTGIFNPIMVDGTFYLHLHRGDPQVAALRDTAKAQLVFQDVMAVIPSHWIDDKYGGAATTYYRYAAYDCRTALIEDPAAMVAVMQNLLDRFQPEKGYETLSHDSDLYRDSFAEILVVKLAVEKRHTKWKLGQNRPVEVRRNVIRRLRERAGVGDLRAADAMARDVDGR